MNNPVDPLEQTTPVSNALRAELQLAVAEPHRILEQIPLMQRYADGDASANEYMAVTRAMLSFWAGHAPTTLQLPETYRRFLASYLDALRWDIGLCSPVDPAETVDEFAFYYVLLGSGLGAKVILRNNRNRDLSKRNLYCLAEHSAPLWKDFNLYHLTTVPLARQMCVKKDSRRLFDALLSEIQKAAE